MKPRSKQQLVKIVRSQATVWTPQIGSELTGLLANLAVVDPAGRRHISNEALSVLSRCLNPHNPKGSLTGLVVGYVQSGKTMSFTAVTALARDNNFQIVILITGTSTHLFHQSEERLNKDLRINSRDDWKWQHYSNPGGSNNTAQKMASTLQEWKDSNVPATERQTILITVMKNRSRLDNLIQVLDGLRDRLSDVPALVIDDEADQAGLNTLAWQRRKGDGSAIYSRLLSIRQKLPCHTFLQYTATPQAPLLINLIDMLSPRFVEVLEPGSEYVGGKDFFVENNHLVRPIPQNDIPGPSNALTSPPDSLAESMRLFFIGVAAEISKGTVKGIWSMMVHPSHRIAKHDDYHRWVNSLRRTWQRLLELPANDPDRKELIAEFRGSYGDLRKTVANLPNFESISNQLLRSIRITHVTPVNSESQAKVDWRATYPHILVGGQAMDRGFTVEGLTVTYMPRGVGVRQADTIQQRARFFGYKRKYLDYCRVYLERAVRTAYTSYVDHEEDIRRRLTAHRATGLPLSEWKRAFFLTTGLKPTRKSVRDLPYVHASFADEWVDSACPHFSTTDIERNRITVREFLKPITLRPSPGHRQRSPDQIHQFADTVSLKAAYNFLVQLSFARPEDNHNFFGLLLQIQSYLERKPKALCTVYRMSPKTRLRKVNKRDVVDNLYQGPNPSVGPNQGAFYPGDSKIHSSGTLTIQIHSLDLHRDDKARVFARDVPAIAAWVPKEMGKDFYVQ